MVLGSNTSVPAGASNFDSPGHFIESTQVYDGQHEQPDASAVPVATDSSVSCRTSRPSTYVHNPTAPAGQTLNAYSFETQVGPTPEVSPRISPTAETVIGKHYSIVGRSSHTLDIREGQWGLSLPSAFPPIRRFPISLRQTFCHCSGSTCARYK